MDKKNELLSPVGSPEAFYAAISNGCNAVYLGLDKFSARAYARNFSLDNLKDYIDYAHLRDVKVFVTMNTILYDEELKEVYNTIDQLAKMNVDAIIVQDLAIINYITNHYKTLEAHASTQIGIDDYHGAKIMKNMGVKRIVFARETPIKTMEEIKKGLGIDIEAFIHGALCVCYSGNCLMSSMIGERSGNRGRCAGCCRQVYTLIDTLNNTNVKTGYLLSMKDLNASSFIKEMKFVDSYKIEGRMKEPLYVASVTNTYRHILDDQKIDSDALNKVFNRTYTKGFMFGENSSNITNIERPNNFGYEIGRVVKVHKNKVWIKLFKKLNKGDQIRIETKNPFEEISIPVLKLFDASFNPCESSDKTVIIYSDEKVDLNAKVYKTKDIKFVEEIEKNLTNKEYKKIIINMEVTGHIGQPLLLKLECQNYKAYAKSDNIIEQAISLPTTKQNIYDQLNKLNNTPYRIGNFIVNLDDKAFIPLKEINELRRKAIANLDSIRLYRKTSLNKPNNIIPQKFDLHRPEISVQVYTQEQYEAAKELEIEHIYYKNFIHRNNPKYIDDDKEILFGGLGSIDYYKDKNKILVSDYSLNVTNYETVAILSSLGVNRITLSQEICKDNINKLIENYFSKYLTYPNLELIVYGRTCLMHSRYCPLKRLNMCGKCKINKYALKDHFATFPITFNSDCTTNIWNSKILNNMDEIQNIIGVNFFRLVFTTETKEETFKIISNFKNSLKNNEKSNSFDKKNHTHGHFFENPL